MSDLLMNMQRRRWQHGTEHIRSADVNTHNTNRLTRASTPGPISLAKKLQQQPKLYKASQIKNKHNANNDDQQIEQNDSDNEEVEEEEDPLANILSLKLRKPKNWKWELTTSKSCTNIALPRILLYDHKGNLLVDAPPGGNNGSHEQVYQQPEECKATTTKAFEKTKKRPYSQQRSSTTNLTHSVRKALEREFDGLQIQEVGSDHATTRTTPSISSTNTTMRSRIRSRKPTIDFSSKDLSDISRRSSSAKGVRFHFDDEYDSKIPDFLPTPPSTTTTPTSSSSAGPREKRKYRRSHSSGRSTSRPPSILERFSYQKGRFSSPESDDERLLDTPPHTGPPRYTLRTDEAGTLLVHQESSSSSLSPRRRKKYHQRNRTSSESNINLQSLESQLMPELSLAPPPPPQSPAQLASDLLASSKAVSEASSSTASSKVRRRKVLPIRRNMTEGDILVDKRLSTSEEELPKKAIELKVGQKPIIIPTCSTLGTGCPCRQQRKYTRNETRDLNSSISPLGLQRNAKIR